MKSKFLYLLLAAGLSGALLTACGSGQNTNTDSSMLESPDTALTMPDTTMSRDTAPAAVQPPGAINPGTDSARYGTERRTDQ